MLGIDIVDINDPSFKERNNRTLDLIRNAEDCYVNLPNLFWIIWSAKEALFKYNRELLNFSPSKIPIKIKEEKGTITFISKNITGSIIVNSHYILAICGDLDKIKYHIFEKKDTDWSTSIRLMITEYFEKLGHNYHVGFDDLNLPVIEPLKEKISISHHGHYGAIAFPKSLL